MSSTTIYTHPLTDPAKAETISQALHLLRPHLPVSLPLYRRLQFGRFFPNTLLLTNLSSLSSPPAAGKQFLLAFLDRTVRPETEIWIFGSWETSSAAAAAAASSTTVDDDATQSEQNEILVNLAKTIKTLPVPESLHQDVSDEATNVRDHAGVSRAEYAGHMADTNIVLCGAIHAATTRILERTGLASAASTHAGLVPNHTYVFDLEESLSDGELDDLLLGLKWGELKHSDFALVRARTQIPRQDKTLAVLPQVAILDKGDRPVAWAFVGLDGALTTLHVEEEYRRRGLAKVLTKRLFHAKMKFLWEEGVRRVSHGYVIHGNEGSCAVCESLGGRADWDVFWVRMDLNAAA